VLLPFTVGLLGSLIYSSLDSWSESGRAVLASVYYIPIVIAAIMLGPRPEVAVALAAGAAHLIAVTVGHTDSWAGPVAQIVLFICVALTAAKLAQRRAGDLRALPGKESPEEFQSAGSDPINNGLEMGVLSRVLVGMVRHFRTPVPSIEGAGWVLDDPQLPDDKRRELVGIVRKEAHRLGRVLSDVMEFTQPARPRFRSINFSTLVDDVIQLETPKDAAAAYVFRKSIPADLPLVRADPEQIRQVLLNIVSNAVQASPQGGQIEISAAAENGKVIVKIKDNGPGIPPAAVDKIFEPFFTTHERSLGLGLPAALRIVKEHGGSIAVERPGQGGTCISVSLPTGKLRT